MPETRKPHHLAHKADVPCWRCGYEWLRPVIDLSNPDADELPVYDVCARCKAKPNESPEVIDAFLSALRGRDA